MRTIAVRLRTWWRPILTAVMLCLAMLLIGPSDPLDRRLSDRLLVRQALPAEPALLVVEINAADMRAYGGPPISRALLARMLDRLAEGGARRVLVDLILTEPLDAGVDRQLSAAMRRLGPKRLALVSGVNPGERPYAAFMRSTAVVDGRLTPDPDSWHRRIGYADANWGANPAIWLATGRADPAPVVLDLRISARAVERRSAGQLLASRDSLDGRIVVISASPQIAPSRVMLPLNQAASRGTVLALAAQGVLQGYPAMQERGAIMNGVLLVMSVALGFAAALSARSGRMLVLLLLAGGAVLFSLSLAVGRSYAVEVFPARILATFLVMANVTVIQRLRIVPMMASFLRGDVTPEEAWVWRSWENSSHPALLLAADGRIKRFNPAAADLVARHGDHLAPLCAPRLGERAEELELTGPEGASSWFLLDWPDPRIAMVILRDNTAIQTAHDAMRRQLLTDELTGKANRRGFDHALDLAAGRGRAFAVFFIDMNGFKAVNDTYGHDAGDELLVIVAGRLGALVGPEDVVARLGGDEFAVVVTSMDDPARARELAQAMRRAIAEPCWLSSVAASVVVGAAVGHALAAADGTRSDPAALVRRADKAMYRDKLGSKLKAA